LKIDLVSPQSFAQGHPHDQYQWLRENDPVHWHDEKDGPGFWVLTRYADVYALGRNHVEFSSQPTAMMEDPPPGLKEALGGNDMMLFMDPPEHLAFRRLVRDEFTKRAANSMQARISTLATEIIDAVIGTGGCDFVNDIAGEMPSYVIAEMMGLPLEDGRELYKLTEILHTSPVALEDGARDIALGSMFGYASRVYAERKTNPKTDLATKLVHAELNGHRLSEIEFQLFFLLLVDAGGDTTRNLLSAGMLALLDVPEQLKWLRADLDNRLPAAREELLRWCTPVIYFRRTAKVDTRISDQAIQAGDKVLMYYGAANYDSTVFENANSLRLDRRENSHLAFGGGAHTCLGQHIARLEIDAMFREILTRLPNLACSSPPEWHASNFISGPKVMPVTFR